MAADIHQQVQEQANQPYATDQVDDFFKHINKASDDAAKEMESKAGKIGDAIAAGVKDGVGKADEAKSQLDKIMADIQKGADYQKFETSDQGKKFKAEGVDQTGMKQLFDLKQGGVGDTQLSTTATTIAAADQSKDHEKEMDNAAKRIDELKAQVAAAQAGMSVEDYKTAQADPAAAAEIKSLEAKLHVTEELKKAAAEAGEQQKKMAEDAARAIEAGMSPLQKEQEQLKNLQALYAAGKITKEQYAAAAAHDEEKLHGDPHSTQQAVTRGSQESFNMMNQINSRVRGDSAAGETGKKHLEEASKVPVLLEKILGKIGGGAALAMASIGV